MENLQNIPQRCARCSKLIIEPMGNPGAKILLVGEYPGHNESIQRKPYAFRPKPKGMLLSGDILQQELWRVGLTFNNVLVTNLWYHVKDEETCDRSLHEAKLFALFSGRTHVLLMGNEVTQALLGMKVDVVQGLRVYPKFHQNIHFWVAPNPTLAYVQPIGELRLAFDKFAEDIRKSQ